MDHMVAGVDTTGDAMCILMWILSMPEYQHVQDKLFEELRSADHAFDPQTKTAPISVLDKLPYLDAVITEGLRCRSPVPMTLFRVVPSGGKTIAGYYIPSGTVVGCQAYSLHRIPEIFSKPDRFNPERWLTSDADKLSAMKSVYWPFSSGARMCLGHKYAHPSIKGAIGEQRMLIRNEPLVLQL
jgi:cytochrome P450